MQLRLSEKIIIIIVVTLVLTIGASFALIYNHATDRARDNVLESSVLRADSVAKDIRNMFENASLATEYLGRHENVREYLKTTTSREDILSNEHVLSVLRTMSEVSGMNENHFIVWIANEQANFYIDSNGYVSEDDYDVHIRPWYDVANRASGVGLTPPYKEWEHNILVISSIQALYDDGYRYGYVAIDIFLKDIPEMIDLMKQGEEDRSYLITESGLYVYHEDDNKVLTASMFDESDQLSEYRNFIQNANGDLLAVEIDGEDYYLISHFVDERGWKIVTLIDKRRTEEGVRGLANRMTTYFIVGMVIAIPLIYIFIRRLTKPLRRLVSFGNRIGSGDFSVDIPDRYINRNDDIGQLSNSFHDIVKTYRNFNEKLEDEIDLQNERLEEQFNILVEQEKQISLGHVVSNVAQGLNAPLDNASTMSGLMEKEDHVLLEKFKKGGLGKSDLEDYMIKYTQAITRMLSNLDDANNIVKNFKMVSLNQNEHIQNFRVADLLSTLRISLKNELAYTELKLDCSIDIYMKSYPSSLINVLNHLIANSVKHGFGSRSGRIEIDVNEDGDFVYIHYKDNGKGLSFEVKDNLFEMHNFKKDSRTGLGMFIIYTTVTQKLEGEITYVDEPGVHFIMKLKKDL